MGRKPKPQNCCVDCGEYALKFKKDYFVATDELWKTFGCERGLLCLECFKKRLGRPFVRGDFQECNANKDNPMIEKLSGFICCLCNKISLGWGDRQQYGNNPRPLADGECCDHCNNTKVIPKRMESIGIKLQ